MRKRRLFVCLNAVRQVAKALVHDSPSSESMSLLNDMRLRYAKIDLMRPHHPRHRALHLRVVRETASAQALPRSRGVVVVTRGDGQAIKHNIRLQ